MSQNPITRRRFLSLACGLALDGVAACLGGQLYATQIEPYWIDIQHVSIALPGLPEALRGLTIAQLSDLHVGPIVQREEVRRAVVMTNSLNPDVVFLTGDFVSNSARYSVACAGELAALKSRYGIFAVLGNHDVWNDAVEVSMNLKLAGIKVLRNESVPLLVGGARLWLLGLVDMGYKGLTFDRFKIVWQSTAARLEALLKPLPADEIRILLVHNPDFNEMLPKGRIDLVVCGHTHGGQVHLPLIGSPIVPSFFGQKYTSGLVHGPTAPVYINRGIGRIEPGVRFNCRPEITLFHLT